MTQTAILTPTTSDSRTIQASLLVGDAVRLLTELYDELGRDDPWRETLRRSLRELGRTGRRLEGMES